MAKRKKGQPRQVKVNVKVKDDWKKAIKVSQNYICPICGNKGNDRSLQIHHICNKCRGGSNSKENCVALCIKCHRWLHKVYGNKTVDMNQFAHYMVEPIDYEDEDK